MSAQDRGALTADLDAILASPGMDGSDPGLVVRTADGELVYNHASDRRRQPASNEKLVTSATALDVLGPDYRFSTTVHAAGSRRGAVLHGDLVLRGTGDPTMLAADYDALAAKVADAGLRVVTGRLVADDTWFDDVRQGVSWAWDDEPYYYNAQVSALTVAPDTDYDAGSIIVRVAPGPNGKAVVTTEPPTDYVTVANTAVTGPAGSANTISVDRVHGTNTFTVTGSIPSGGATTSEWMAVWEPTDFAASLFRAALGRHGVQVVGQTTRGAVPAAATVVATRTSMPLRELLVPFLKLSNNLHAEILVKAMGRATSDQGTWTAGLDAVSSKLSAYGINPARVSLRDGSGLSRMDQISPDQLVSLLGAARNRPWFHDWYEALPIAGETDKLVGGTLRSRMRGTPAEGNVHAKTGSLTGVSSLSGYVTTADGQQWVFSMVTNNGLGVTLKNLEDAVAVRLAQEGSTARMVIPSTSPSSAVSELECSWVKAC
ncbi:D-alanyl-D-alanine carboxypeptidase/D-alanyl-D-alanine endopeptidase [Actinophytocola oryzae]|uniref:D-alanyl-D-alanine carboxypeptidase/D-alanyl-D-alanine endopeptidase n=1 Tax=Actinophytocola oryzae TaxID=502181 RepID=UPI001FBB5A4A|nr:D-alanyl-D-alanine carboxypeptidase/D-alanyl-D-alanine-endopeptidase [Actinophytocola oryzae]